MTWQTDSTSSNATFSLGEVVGRRLKGGEVIELVSDLGGGKTVFVRGLAKGMGSQDQVASPTFTISRQYTSNNLILYHYDFYRLNDPGIMREELSESIQDKQGVVAIEWAAIVEDVLPKDRLSVTIKSTGPESRFINLTAGNNHKHLIG